MKSLHRVSLVLIAIPLLALLWGSRWMIVYVQPEGFRGEITDNWVHEIGFARLTLAIIGLLILFIPYRKSERWAFVALAILVVFYVLPAVFFLSNTNLGHWEILHKLAWPEPGPRSISLAELNFDRHFFPILAFAGLAIAVPQFITGTRNARLKDIQTP
jgi:hypothetical protein